MKCAITDWPNCLKETQNKNGVCDNCSADGWTGDPIEVAAAIANDPLLAGKVAIASPIQPEL